MIDKPTEVGYYAWRTLQDRLPYSKLCRVFKHEGTLYVNFNIEALNNRDFPLSSVASREWFKVEGL